MLDKRKFYIDGQWINPEKKDDFEVINPSNEETCAIISLGSYGDLDFAVKSARKAFESWRNVSKEEKIWWRYLS